MITEKRNTCTHTHTHTQTVIMATSSSLNTHTIAGAHTQSHWLLFLGKEMGFSAKVWKTEWSPSPWCYRGGYSRGSDISEGLLAVPLCLGPGNIKERSRCWSEKARRVVFLEKIREVEGVVIMNQLVSGRENFVADPFLDGKPMKLSKNGSDVVWFFCISWQFLLQHFALPVDV